jgi:hypothetical protein
MIDLPSPVRILAALEFRPRTWTRTGPWSIAHADLRVRLTLGVNIVHIERIARGIDPVTIKAAPTTRARIGVQAPDIAGSGPGLVRGRRR